MRVLPARLFERSRSCLRLHASESSSLTRSGFGQMRSPGNHGSLVPGLGPRNTSSGCVWARPLGSDCYTLESSVKMVAEQLLAMDPPSVTLGVRVVILAALAALCAYLFYLAYLHPLADVPGPLLGKFSDLWKLIHMRRSDFSSSLGDLHRKYG